mgnify:CR=1 FL=1
MSDRRVPLEIERAFGLRKDGRTEEAIVAFLDALAVHPTHAKGWWTLGGIYWERRELSEAVRCFRRAVELRPRNEDCSTGLFHALADAGHIDDAVQEARRFLRQVASGADCSPETLQVYRDYDRDGVALAEAWRKSRD